MDRLSAFFNSMEGDARIGLSHISLYCAILQMSNDADGSDCVLAYSKELMKKAKISGLGTYHKTIRELHEFGYIKYHPSYNHRKKSKMFI